MSAAELSTRVTRWVDRTVNLGLLLGCAALLMLLNHHSFASNVARMAISFLIVDAVLTFYREARDRRRAAAAKAAARALAAELGTVRFTTRGPR